MRKDVMNKRRDIIRSEPAAATTPAKPKAKDEQWDDRLRRVGNANYVAVDWSAYDKPCWPLPMD
jgi:hypothetical protein